MPRRHKHWPEDSPYYERAQWCRFPTLKACDEWFTWFSHGHMGVPCVKQQQPSKSKRGRMNSIATCTLIQHPEVGESFAENLARQALAYNESNARVGD